MDKAIKRIMIVLILSFCVASFVLITNDDTASITTNEQVDEVVGEIIVEEETQNIVETPLLCNTSHAESDNDEVGETEIIIPTEKVIPTKVEDPIDVAKSEMQLKLDKIENISDKREWFIAYKNIIEEYKDIIDTPETIYDVFNEQELELLFRVVQAEIGGYGFEPICNVVSVIYNRIASDYFGDEMSTVLTYDQFATISNGRYLKVDVEKSVILACEYVYIFGDTTDGALFFESGNRFVHSAYADYMFTDDAGHHFYK